MCKVPCLNLHETLKNRNRKNLFVYCLTFVSEDFIERNGYLGKKSLFATSSLCNISVASALINADATLMLRSRYRTTKRQGWGKMRGNNSDDNRIKRRSMPQVKDLKVSGRIGPVIFYFVGDNLYSRAAPGKIKQAPKTKIRSTNFGIAARAGKALRVGFVDALPNAKDRHMQSRFSGGIAKWLGSQLVKTVPPAEDIPGLYRFQFAGLWAFEDTFHVPFTVSMTGEEAIEIHVPAFIPVESMKGPWDSISADCTFAVATCDLATGMPLGNNLVRWNIPYNNAAMPAQTFTLPYPQAAGSLLIITGGLRFNVLKNGVPFISDYPSYITCSVIKSWYL